MRLELLVDKCFRNIHYNNVFDVFKILRQFLREPVYLLRKRLFFTKDIAVSYYYLCYQFLHKQWLQFLLNKTHLMSSAMNSSRWCAVIFHTFAYSHSMKYTFYILRTQFCNTLIPLPCPNILGQLDEGK